MSHTVSLVFRWCVSLFILALPLSAAISEADRNNIDQVTGVKGTYTADEGVYRVSFPRTDVKVSIEGRSMHPFLGLTSWAAFTSAQHGESMVMGDLVLFEDEVNPVMSAALDSGLEVTALHNHFFFESPRVMFMHIGGSGPVDKLATGVRRAIDKVKEIRAANSQPGSKFNGPIIPETSSILASAIDSILQTRGQVNAGMYKATLGRQATMHGQTVGNQMGVNTWAAFAGTDEAAFVDGDFAMLKSEVQSVLKALRKANINIVAIHNHMTQEEPQFIFLHYWGKGPAAELARGVRSALDTQAPKQTAANIVFVCEHGAARSVIAAEYFNKLAAERGLAFRAVSRGTSPDPEFGTSTIAGLRGDGFPAPAGKPRLLQPGDLQPAERVVTFAVNLPDGMKPIQRIEWNDIPAPSADYAKARDEIRNRVEELINDLGKSKTH